MNLLHSAFAVLILVNAAVAFQRSAGWEWKGPTTYYTRDDELKITSAGAIQDVVSSSGGVWFVGSVNGGVWRTSTLQDESPKWENVIDGQPVRCSSISALHVSAADSRRIYAGCGGSTSSEQGYDWNVMNSGEWGGAMYSADQGYTWKMIEDFPPNYYITSIYETEPGVILIAAQSHLWDRNDGGIWRLDITKEKNAINKVLGRPTFTLTALENSQNEGKILIATHARSTTKSVSITTDGGVSWNDFGQLDWGQNLYPFYTCAAEMKNGDLVVAGLTADASNVSSTNSKFFIKKASSKTWQTFPQIESMDQDAMPKDRMAIMADPQVPDLMYVAGNAGALAWRVNVTTSTWTKMWDKDDVPDGSLPHGDCRNYAWDHEGGRLVLVSDGGIFARFQPRAPNGRWVSLNGNYASMELLSAHYDNRDNRFVAGAQDNCAQVTEPNAAPTSTAIGFVEGDGTVTMVDNVQSPARLYGTTQFLGVGTIYIDPSLKEDAGNKDDDEDCGGLCFVQGEKFINVPIDVYFPEPSSFPFFVQPYALNSQDPTKLYFWANGTKTRASAFYRFIIAPGVKSKRDIPPPELVLKSPANSFFLDFVSGGYTNGKPDEDLIIGMSNSHLYVFSANTGGEMIVRSLPTRFAVPVTLPYDQTNKGARILGPVTHGRTVSLSVSSSNSSIIAVTGWPSVRENMKNEEVWVTLDAGNTWHNLTANLREASGVVGTVRPSGLKIVELLENKAMALLVSTSNGVMVAFFGSTGEKIDAAYWRRYGSTSEFPQVLCSAISYEHYSDTLVVATFGRGIYALSNAKNSLLDVYYSRQQNGTRVKEQSSAKFFPPQL